MKSGSIYEGQVNDLNERHGYGVYSVVAGGRYEGEWVKGFKHGQGKFFTKEGTLGYEGEWECGEPHGVGKTYNAAGNCTYEGEFKKGFKKGSRRITYRDLMKKKA
ncbi:unnamed protein product [Moneuplotes crassus]|uniref:Uncharacterized protein n=1 Tax=Euplotes crassus TaxID=5936 RepID=A0AAD1Y0H3_EUPCR|nr:unnamed protein product [Moneuplotes crassus]